MQCVGIDCSSITVDTKRNISYTFIVNHAPPASFARFSMRLPRGLSRELDAVVKEEGARSRSHWVADLIRTNLVEHAAATTPTDVLAGTVTIVYRGAASRVRRQLSETLSSFLKEVISSQHVLLAGKQSLEVLVVQGPAARLRDMSDAIRKVRGVQQVRLTTTLALVPQLHEPGPQS